MTTPKTGAPEWAASQASPDVTVNESLRRIEAGAGQYTVVDKDLTAPPGSCADGATYIVAATATGAWTGMEKKLASAVGANASNGWYFRTPEEGIGAYVQDENAQYRYDGSAWGIPSTGAGSGDVVGPASATDSHFAQFDSTTGKLLKDGGLALDTDGTLAANSDTKIATQKAVRTAINAAVAGLSWKQAVRVATTANGTLASAFENGDTLDGVTLATGDRILIKNQSSGAENGIYVVAASGAPARATDADSGAELVNASVYVSEGTTNADTQWTCTTNATITVGSTSLAFAQLTSGGGALLAANNLSDVSNAGTARTNLGLGTAATQNTGASGANVPLLNGANTHSGLATFSAGADLTPAAAPSTTAVGYLGAPQNLGLDSGNVTLALTDCGKHVYHTDANARDLTIPANASVAFVIGTVIAGVNESGAGVVTLKITSDTLRWGSSTGQRTIAANATFSLLKVAATVWRLTGDGIT